MGEDAALGGLLDEVGIARVEEGDHGAGGFANDLVDQVERVLRALSKADERDVRVWIELGVFDEKLSDLNRG